MNGQRKKVIENLRFYDGQKSIPSKDAISDMDFKLAITASHTMLHNVIDDINTHESFVVLINYNKHRPFFIENPSVELIKILKQKLGEQWKSFCYP